MTTGLPPWTMLGTLAYSSDRPAGSMAILALDLATQTTGWALFVDTTLQCAGSVAFRAGDDLPTRLRSIGAWLQQALVIAPDILALESPDLMDRAITTTPGTLKALYSAYGVAVEAARRARIRHIWTIDARQVKWRLAGQQTASKLEIQRAVKLRGYRLPLTRRGQTDHDAADAIALGLCVADDVVWARRYQGAPAPRSDSLVEWETER